MKRRGACVCQKINKLKSIFDDWRSVLCSILRFPQLLHSLMISHSAPFDLLSHWICVGVLGLVSVPTNLATNSIISRFLVSVAQLSSTLFECKMRLNSADCFYLSVCRLAKMFHCLFVCPQFSRTVGSRITMGSNKINRLRIYFVYIAVTLCARARVLHLICECVCVANCCSRSRWLLRLGNVCMYTVIQ